jgi:hypothetical protein
MKRTQSQTYPAFVQPASSLAVTLHLKDEELRRNRSASKLAGCTRIRHGAAGAGSVRMSSWINSAFASGNW